MSFPSASLPRRPRLTREEAPWTPSDGTANLGRAALGPPRKGERRQKETTVNLKRSLAIVTTNASFPDTQSAVSGSSPTNPFPRHLNTCYPRRCGAGNPNTQQMATGNKQHKRQYGYTTNGHRLSLCQGARGCFRTTKRRPTSHSAWPDVPTGAITSFGSRQEGPLMGNATQTRAWSTEKGNERLNRRRHAATILKTREACSGCLVRLRPRAIPHSAPFGGTYMTEARPSLGISLQGESHVRIDLRRTSDPSAPDKHSLALLGTGPVALCFCGVLPRVSGPALVKQPPGSQDWECFWASRLRVSSDLRPGGDGGEEGWEMPEHGGRSLVTGNALEANMRRRPQWADMTDGRVKEHWRYWGAALRKVGLDANPCIALPCLYVLFNVSFDSTDSSCVRIRTRYSVPFNASSPLSVTSPASTVPCLFWTPETIEVFFFFFFSSGAATMNARRYARREFACPVIERNRALLIPSRRRIHPRSLARSERRIMYVLPLLQEKKSTHSRLGPQAWKARHEAGK
ncbi:hypothetical protein CCUS01_16954 [Colletotrichum cuscutae]|uniref:Uncharacterized protein n=1 Tax=Colletotrichum cuscutae TaxID=1209917 RepID=A0AAI9V9Y7_9PEZI|nr:hypothetical protein CCUS01_16954 [Colletotrichum cuscutae]